MRAIGVALDKNTLQQVAYANGINMSVDAMTRAQKTELIYYQIMTSTQRMQGMLAKSTISPQVAIMQLKNEFLQLARAIGSVFIPIAMKIIPVVRAITQILTEAAQWLAGLFGFKLGEYTVNVQDMGASIGGIADNLDNVGGSARKATRELQKMLMPFDELNNVNFETGSSGGSGSGSGIGGVGGSLGLPLPEYDMFAGLDNSINDKVENIKNKFKEFLPILKQIAELFAAIWTIKKISDFAGALRTVATNLGLISQAAGTGSIASGGTGLVGSLGVLALAVLDIQDIIEDLTFVVGNYHEEEEKWKKRTGKEELTFMEKVGAGLSGLGSGYLKNRFGKEWVDENTDKPENIWDKTLSSDDWGKQSFLKQFLGTFPTMGYQLGEVLKGNKSPYEALEKTPIMNWGIPLGNKLGEKSNELFGKLAEPFVNFGDKAQGNIMNNVFNPIISWGDEIQDNLTPLKEVTREGVFKEWVQQGTSFLSKHGALAEGIDDLTSKLGNLGKAWKDLPTTIKGAVDKIKEKVPKIFTGIKDKVLPTVTTIKDNVVSKFGLLKDGVISKIKSTDSEGTSVFSTIKNSFTGKSEETKNSVVSKFEETKNGILGKLGLTKTEGSTALEEAKNLFMAKASETKDGTVNAYKLLKDNSVKELIKLRDDGSITAEEFRAKLKTKMEAIPNENLSPLDKLKRGVLSTLSDTSSGAGSKMDEIKRKLNFSGFHWQLPSLKLPHFSWSSITNTVSSGIKGILSKLSLPISLPKLNVSWWAEGGFPNAGELFIANEAGPELIGNIGRRTAVANQNQITEGIANATYNAFTRALQENGGGNNGDNYFEVNVGDERIYSGYATRRDRDSKRYGVQT